LRFNQAVDPTSPSYTRPPAWRRQVAPLHVSYPSYVIAFFVALAVFAAVGVPFQLLWVLSLGVGLVAAGGAELWWRRNRPPSADRPHRRLVTWSGRNA
jgi:hypothetical protein